LSAKIATIAGVYFAFSECVGLSVVASERPYNGVTEKKSQRKLDEERPANANNRTHDSCFSTVRSVNTSWNVFKQTSIARATFSPKAERGSYPSDGSALDAGAMFKVTSVVDEKLRGEVVGTFND
jgi:hypothetical protein